MKRKEKHEVKIVQKNVLISLDRELEQVVGGISLKKIERIVILGLKVVATTTGLAIAGYGIYKLANSNFMSNLVKVTGNLKEASENAVNVGAAAAATAGHFEAAANELRGIANAVNLPELVPQLTTLANALESMGKAYGADKEASPEKLTQINELLIQVRGIIGDSSKAAEQLPGILQQLTGTSIQPGLVGQVATLASTFKTTQTTSSIDPSAAGTSASAAASVPSIVSLLERVVSFLERNETVIQRITSGDGVIANKLFGKTSKPKI